MDILLEIDVFVSKLPLMASANDGVVSPATAVEIGRLGGVGVLNLEGLWTRYEDPEPLLAENRGARARRRDRPHAADLHRARQARARQPAHPGDQRCRRDGLRLGHAAADGLASPAVLEAELDLLVIQGTVVVREHVPRNGEPLNLKRFIVSSTSPSSRG